jgi:hypothetical protein
MLVQAAPNKTILRRCQRPHFHLPMSALWPQCINGTL